MPALQIPSIVGRALARLVGELREKYGERLREVRLFGSYARGEARADSDVDVLVLLDRLNDGIERLDVGELVAGVGVDEGLLIEGVVMSEAELAKIRSLETAFAAALDREGITL